MEKFNPTRYQGTWYEIAKYPAKFITPEVCHYSVAEYRYNKLGNHLNVMNTCYDSKNIPILSILGVATPTSQYGNFSLKFIPESYNPIPITNDQSSYNVLYTDYDNLAIVSGDSDSYFLLSRKPGVNKAQLDFLTKKTLLLGYDPKRLVFNRYR